MFHIYVYSLLKIYRFLNNFLFYLFIYFFIVNETRKLHIPLLFFSLFFPRSPIFQSCHSVFFKDLKSILNIYKNLSYKVLDNVLKISFQNLENLRLEKYF